MSEADNPFAAFGPAEAVKVGKIQRITGTLLHRSWSTIPHVTHHDEADITDFETRRQAWNAAHPDAKVTPLAALVKASVSALKALPIFNSSLSEDGATLYRKAYHHIGIAVDTPNGLLVPVIRDCDVKDQATIAAEIAAVAGKARERGLGMAEMSGGCFSITSLGHIGGTGFTPIINAPEVAILGVTKLVERPVRGPDGAVVWRKMLPLSLSYDHRVVNGADAARFTRHIAEFMAGAAAGG
ncbi:2-oxo acid dehydrogenase subunit E2 [Sphingomonas sp. MG17]|uniref:Dihydrolipoyllysine-residue acetyltransferase component of pyruvate dehydrogenase complex n=1 Tax=Sphingomonas tagetis TaxID=2949092 RepID=A0A9X2HHE6_9SPHN|nr:2-oxo acid dehydrogenase subunit E2 [Sphingomonas tagetis]